MLRVPITMARPGMTLAMPVRHPARPDLVLLRAGVLLDGPCIDRLRELRMRELWIRYPSLEFLAEYVSPAIFESCARVARRIGDTFDEAAGGAGAKIDYYEYKRTVGELLENLASDPKAALFVQEIADGGSPLLRHSSNVCLLSVLMGLKLEAYLIAERKRLSAANARDVTALGVGAMLHDIGMLRLSPETLARWDATGDESDPAFREHVAHGHAAVHGEIDPSAAAVVLHHHQRVDGSGFPTRAGDDGKPLGLRAHEIHVFARIAAVADVFDRLRRGGEGPGLDPAAPQAMPTVRALRLLREPPWRDRLDPVAVRALVNVAPAFPPGSAVRLSDGRAAAVTDWDPNHPCRPSVAIVDELEEPAGWRRREPELIDLQNNRSLSIVEAEGFDVRDDLFDPAFPGEFDMRRLAKSISNAAA